MVRHSIPEFPLKDYIHIVVPQIVEPEFRAAKVLKIDRDRLVRARVEC